MSSLFGKTIAFLVLVAATVALGYTAWEIRDLKASLARTAQGNESNLTEMMISLAHAEGQLARVRETVELLGASGLSENSDGTALEGKLTAALSSAQREVLQQELKKWTQQLREQRDKSLAAVRESLEQEVGRSVAQGNQQLSALVERNQGSLTEQLKDLGTNLAKPSGSTVQQGQTLANLEKRLAAVADTVREQGQALAQRNERDDKRWDELSLALEESMKATQRRYAEVAALLKAQNDGAAKPDNATTGSGQAGQGTQSPAGDRAQQERLAEFCAEVPQSALCRNR
ncbi:MAG: hypothetical protein OXU42_15330 [Deltaproteobacteria bacterium]|nr:hypothetical protein [Deltaproteobacteria bacterium]